MAVWTRVWFWTTCWIVIALLVAQTGTAHAASPLRLVQVVDGYTVTLSMDAQPAPPGDNPVAVAIQEPDGRAVTGADVSIALLAYLRTVATNPQSAQAATPHVHTPGASATEGQGLIPIPVRLTANGTGGAYRGVLSFAREGTWTTVVAFSIQGLARAALFKIGIIDQRPRLALVGGFALVNVAIIVTAALRKRTLSSHRRHTLRSAGGAGTPPPGASPYTQTHTTGVER